MDLHELLRWYGNTLRNVYVNCPRLGADVIVLKVLDLAEHGRGVGHSCGWRGRNLGSFLNLVVNQ